MNKRILSIILISCFFFLFSSCGENSTAPNTDPTILNLSQNYGLIGSIIDINGKNFGAVQGSGYVEFNGVRTTASDIILWSDIKITVKVPANATTGKLFINVNGKNSNQFDFTVDIGPYIVSLNPSSFSLGNKFEINGRNFGDNQMGSYVEFARGERPAVSDYESWSDVKIVLSAPSTITASGKLFVSINGNKKSNAVEYKINGFPYINDVSPDSVSQGEELTINGSGFGSSKGTSYVNFGGFQGSEYSLWSDGKIIVRVPLNLIIDTIDVRRSDGKRSNKYYVKILPPEIPPPAINNINPNPATNGQNITITGDYFGSSLANSQVKISNVICTEYTSWSNTEIIVKVPDNAITGTVIVIVNNKESNAYNITVQPLSDDPHIEYIDVQSAIEGQSIGINGSNFGAVRDSSFVEFNGTNANVNDYVSWTDIRIIVKVPAGATTGLVKIHVGSKVSNGENLIIQ